MFSRGSAMDLQNLRILGFLMAARIVYPQVRVNKTRNVTLRRVHATIGAVEKQ
jgi:hypothetical protein